MAHPGQVKGNTAAFLQSLAYIGRTLGTLLGAEGADCELRCSGSHARAHQGAFRHVGSETNVLVGEAGLQRVRKER